MQCESIDILDAFFDCDVRQSKQHINPLVWSGIINKIRKRKKIIGAECVVPLPSAFE
jgi:hypothetical protein